MDYPSSERLSMPNGESTTRRRFWRTLAGVLLVQVISLGLLWILQMLYG